MSGGTYSLTSTPNDRFLRNFFMAGLFTLRVIARNLLGGSRRRNIFFFIFRFDDWLGIRIQAFASNKPTHYILTTATSINKLIHRNFGRLSQKIITFLPKNVGICYGVFFSTKKMSTLFKKNEIFCLFLKNFSPSKRVICFILNNSNGEGPWSSR